MAEQLSIEETPAVEKKAEEKKPAAKKAAPKKAAAKKPAAKKPAAKKAAAKKATAKRTTAKKPAAKKAADKKASPEFATRARENGRKAFLASLGFYGKAFDQAQEQFSNLQDQLKDGRGNADKLYEELVKRGEKVEADAKNKIDELEIPKFELEGLTDRAKLEAQLEKAKARFEELKEKVNFKSAA